MGKENLDGLEKEDRILFNERKVPLEVDQVDENRVHVKGPQGGEYILFSAEQTDDLLVRNKESQRRYATYVEDLRKVGKWEKKSENLWRHSKSGTETRLTKNDAGFWTLETPLEFEEPKYGFSSREFAEEKVKKIIEKNPEG